MRPRSDVAASRASRGSSRASASALSRARLDQALDPTRGAGEHARHLVRLERGQRKKPGRLPLADRVGVDAVERQRVEVDVQIERRAEALDEADGAALLRANAPLPPRAPAQLREQGPDEGAQHLAREPRVVGAAVTEWVGQREHPLTDRHLRQHAIDEVSRRICHATPATRRTEAAALAREGDEAVVAALVAVEPKEAVCENATAKERAKLLLDEARRRLLPKGRAREEVFQLLADDLVKEGLLRLVALILGHGVPFRDRRGAAPSNRLGVKPWACSSSPRSRWRARQLRGSGPVAR